MSPLKLDVLQTFLRFTNSYLICSMSIYFCTEGGWEETVKGGSTVRFVCYRSRPFQWLQRPEPTTIHNLSSEQRSKAGTQRKWVGPTKSFHSVSVPLQSLDCEYLTSEPGPEERNKTLYLTVQLLPIVAGGVPGPVVKNVSVGWPFIKVE